MQHHRNPEKTQGSRSDYPASLAFVCAAACVPCAVLTHTGVCVYCNDRLQNTSSPVIPILKQATPFLFRPPPSSALPITDWLLVTTYIHLKAVLFRFPGHSGKSQVLQYSKRSSARMCPAKLNTGGKDSVCPAKLANSAALLSSQGNYSPFLPCCEALPCENLTPKLDINQEPQS